ncbi:MAG TPA: DNA polymerase ligase N-terminal domain-containing protein [Methylobacterium sp.]
MRSFVVHKHAARRPHYDLRLKLDGVLKSWALTKGPSLIAGEKRLAVQVPDHGLDYGGFEGTIPEGSDGAGAVLLWDRGTWEPAGDPAADHAARSLAFTLHGTKLSGGWRLVRMRRRPAERRVSWLLIKVQDAAARSRSDPDVLADEASVLSDRSVADLMKP